MFDFVVVGGETTVCPSLLFNYTLRAPASPKRARQAGSTTPRTLYYQSKVLQPCKLALSRLLLRQEVDLIASQEYIVLCTPVPSQYTKEEE